MVFLIILYFLKICPNYVLTNTHSDDLLLVLLTVFACTTGNWYTLLLSKYLSNGMTNSKDVTQQDTGFPGKARIILNCPLYEAVANVVGFLKKNVYVYFAHIMI